MSYFREIKDCQKSDYNIFIFLSYFVFKSNQVSQFNYQLAD